MIRPSPFAKLGAFSLRFLDCLYYLIPINDRETFYNPDIAETLELLAREGPEVFYNGILADELVEACTTVHPLTKKYGLISKEDLQSYRAVYRQPLKSTYRSHTVFGFPPPGAGKSIFHLITHKHQRGKGETSGESGENGQLVNC